MVTSLVTEVQVVKAPPAFGGPACLLVRLVSDTGGIGLGELGSGPVEDLTDAVEWVSARLVGSPVTDRQAAWHRFRGAADDWEDEEWLAATALAGLDAAMWDLGAKSLGVPLTVLMGGQARSRLDVCVDCGEVTDAAAVGAANTWLAAGIRAFSFSAANAPQLPDALRNTRRVLGVDPLIVLRLRGNARSVEDATKLGAMVDQFEPYWVEGLLPDGQWSELGRVRAAIASPTGAGAETVGVHRFWRALESQCADVVTPSLALCDGPTGVLRLADLVELRGLRMALDAGDSLVSVLTAAAVCFARQGVTPLRLSSPALQALIACAPERVRDGFLLPGAGEGIGIADIPEADLDIIASFPGE